MAFEVQHIISFAIYTVTVGVITTVICRKFMAKSENATDDYFAGGRSLQWYVVAGSLLLTNLSTEQFVGLNGAVFKDGCLVAVWWEAGAAFAMIITAAIFLPHYMQLGLITTSGFLGERYDKALRALVSAVFLCYYAAVLCPIVLYTGAFSIREIFDLDVDLWVVSTGIGLLGSAYALAGGLKAVAVSDCLNGIGLIFVGLWIPITALQLLPGGFMDIFYDPQILQPLASSCEVFDDATQTRSWQTPSLPWHVPFISLQLNNIYYFSTNQVIVQRALGAQSLAHGQKGVMFAASMKALGWTFLCLPGLVAILLELQKVEINGKLFKVDKADHVLPLLVKAVMPDWALGWFLGILLGSVLSTFNSALNSAATMFGLEIYQVYINPEATQEKVVSISTVFGAILAVVAFAIAPMLEGTASIFDFLQQLNTIVSLPILTVFFVGIFTELPDAFAAKVGFVVGIIVIILGQFFTAYIHFLHVFTISFVLASSSMFLATYVQPFRSLFSQPDPVPRKQTEGLAKVDIVPWKALNWIIAGVVVILVLLFGSLQFGSQEGFFAYWGCWALVLIALFFSGVNNSSSSLNELKIRASLADTEMPSSAS